jgi:predicted GTPase
MKKELKNTDKVMVSCRIPVYVKEYIEKKNLKIADIMMKGFDEFRSTDVEHALNRLDYHEKRVLHWRHIVLQNDEQCNTKYHICNTIKKTFVEQGRGTSDTLRMDMSWCTAKAEQLVNEGIIITGKELYGFCVRGDGK